MLRFDHHQLGHSQIPDYSPAQAGGGLTELIALAFGFVRRQYLIIVLLALLGSSVGVIYLFVTPPAYTAHSKIITDIRKGQFLQKSVIAETPLDSAQIESQLQILLSETLATSVINDLRLTEIPEFAPPSDEPRSKADIMRDAIAIFQSKLEVGRVGASYVIDIGFKSENPERAARIADAVAEHFISEEQNAQFGLSQKVGAWLQTRLKGLREQVSAADRAVVEFAKENNIVNADGKLMDDQRLADLNSRLVGARSRTAETLAKLFRIQAVTRKGQNDENNEATVSDALSDSIVTSLRQRYLDLVNREKDWAQRYGPDHQAVVRLREQQAEIRESLRSELQRLAESYKSDYAIAKRHEEEIQQQLASAVSQVHLTNKEQIKLAELKSTAQSYHNLYDNFLRQYTESVEQQSFPIPQARVISHASIPLSKSQPKSKLILFISFMGGLGLGVGIGLFRELMDRVFRTSDQVETLLQKPCVALIPRLDAKAGYKLATNRKLIGGQSGSKTIVRRPGLHWALVDSPSSRFAEGIRSIKLAVDAATLNGADRPNKIIGFTSSLPSEGKSTIATAFAQLSAQVGDKVIVVDCDLRNPSLSRAFASSSGPGLVDVITGRQPLESVVWREPTTKFEFLPVGNNLRLTHTSEILSSDLAKEFFDGLRQKYDYVIVDLPPLAPIVDARATVRFVDSYFAVVAWGETKVDVVQHALHSAQGIYENLSGIILNKTDFRSLGRYEIYRDKYYYNKYYSRYGYTE